MRTRNPNQISPAKRLGLFVLVCLVGLIVIELVLLLRQPNKPPQTVTESTESKIEARTGKDEPIPFKQATEPPVAPQNDYRSKYFYAGMPKVVAYPNPLLVLTNIGYVVAYDDTRKNPVWGCYRLFKVDNLIAPPRPKSFRIDNRTMSRMKTGDYTGSGYNRGHLGAPNFAIGVCYGSEAQQETFLMSNITPQKPRMNQDIFENMERYEIRDLAQRYDEIWIIAGNIFDDNIERLKSGVEIPDACFHVVVDEYDGEVRALAFIIPQSVTGKEQLGQFRASVDEIEARTGLDLLSELPDDVEDRVEREKGIIFNCETP